MEPRGATLKKLLLGGILFVLMLPFIQQHIKMYRSKPLGGQIVPADKVYFSVDGWFGGSYQDGYAKWFNENFGFRNELLRLRNQIAYSFFGVAKANDIIIGKDLYLYERNYIYAWQGFDFVGLPNAEKLTDQIALLQDSLKKKGVTLIICLAPGKASYYPEYIPDEYGPGSDSTNYKILSALMRNKNVNVLDYVQWFGQMKGKTPYPLFPRTGTHWSQYGCMLALDSLLKFIEDKRNIDLPDMVWDGIETDDTIRNPDDDIGKAMNLLFPIQGLTMGYPRVHFADTTGKARVRLMTISDSFFWQMYNLGIEPDPFAEVSFYYYNRELHRQHHVNSNVQAQNSVSDVTDHDVVVLMVTEGNLSEFGWGFIRDAFDHFVTAQNVRSNAQRISDYENAIRSDEKWMTDIRAKAERMNITVDSAIHMDALYLLKNETSGKK